MHPASFPVNNNVTTSNKPPNFPADEEYYSVEALVNEPPSSGVAIPPPSPSVRGGTSRGRYLEGEFTATGKFLGFSQLKFVLSNGDDAELKESPPVEVKVGFECYIFFSVLLSSKIFLYILLFHMGV